MEKFEMTGYFDLDELLKRINNGKDVNYQDSNKYNALILASYLDCFEVVRDLLKHPDIDINIQTDNGDTAIIWASYYGNVRIVKELLRHPDINIDIIDKRNKTVLDYAIEYEDEEIITLIKTLSYIKENKDMFAQLGIDNSIVETVISEENCFEVNKQNIDSLIQQYKDGSVSVVETEEL